MTCRFQTITEEPWRGCRCGAKEAQCRAPDRQHPKTPPLDHAGFHSRRVPDGRGGFVTEYTLVNSLYCSPRCCKSYAEAPELDSVEPPR